MKDKKFTRALLIVKKDNGFANFRGVELETNLERNDSVPSKGSQKVLSMRDGFHIWRSLWRFCKRLEKVQQCLKKIKHKTKDLNTKTDSAHNNWWEKSAFVCKSLKRAFYKLRDDPDICKAATLEGTVIDKK